MMIKKFNIILFSALLIVFAASGCAKTGKDAARESCDCVKKVLDSKITDVNKFHEDIKKCREELKQKYEKKLNSDKQFKKEFDAEAEVCNKEIQQKFMKLYQDQMK
jgi:hypothetical protein